MCVHVAWRARTRACVCGSVRATRLPRKAEEGASEMDVTVRKEEEEDEGRTMFTRGRKRKGSRKGERERVREEERQRERQRSTGCVERRASEKDVATVEREGEYQLGEGDKTSARKRND